MNCEHDEMRARLLAMLEELESHDDLGRTGQKIVELDQQAVGRLSRMDALLSQSMGKAQQTRRNQLRMRIQATIARLDEGEFGYCVDCGELIDKKRLSIDPTLPKCMSCTQG